MWFWIKAAKYEIPKPSTCRATLFRCKFRRCFPFFTLRDQLYPQQKHLLRVEEMRRANWLTCWGKSKFVTRQVASFMKNEQQSQNLLLAVDPRSTFWNNFLKPATNVFVARQVDHTRWRTRNINENLQRNNVAREVEGFCISYFAALKHAQVHFPKTRKNASLYSSCYLWSLNRMTAQLKAASELCNMCFSHCF